VDDWGILSEDRLFDFFNRRWVWLSLLENRGLDVNVLVLDLWGGRSGLKFCGS
jgi:hypothetical protein